MGSPLKIENTQIENLETHLGLEGAEQVAQIRVFGTQSQHLSFNQGALHVVVLEHDVFLQALDRVVVLRVLQLCEEDLSEAAFSQHLQEKKPLLQKTATRNGNGFKQQSYHLQKTTIMIFKEIPKQQKEILNYFARRFKHDVEHKWLVFKSSSMLQRRTAFKSGTS